MNKLNLDQLFFNSVRKTVTNHIFRLEKYFEEIYTLLMFRLIIDLAGLLN